MSPSKSDRPISPVGQMYRNEYARAVDLWKSGSHEEAYIICRDLLVDPAVGKWHQAGFHLFLGNSEDCYVEHTQRARDLYDEMPKETLRIDPNKDVAGLTQYLEMAEVMLAQPLLKLMAR
ncbi:hypothetical protein J4E90_001671 [Alternaria incomplexa]|uniref:uncharacterized protein n=1 Tax=Alternaria incomplexa TaxID=1187928 RepID=UPI00221F521B|nr:uncharacterized protein J4E90_001671 [Alternaria incomplexa]KAI4919536.1 hypothetical protein J4E90_001671 [Alternaria incomplexa]